MIGETLGLIGLISDLGTSAVLQEEFSLNPDAVGARYSIESSELEALKAGDIKALEECMGLAQGSLSNSTIGSYHLIIKTYSA